MTSSESTTTWFAPQRSICSFARSEELRQPISSWKQNLTAGGRSRRWHRFIDMCSHAGLRRRNKLHGKRSQRNYIQEVFSEKLGLPDGRRLIFGKGVCEPSLGAKIWQPLSTKSSKMEGDEWQWISVKKEIGIEDSNPGGGVSLRRCSRRNIIFSRELAR